MRYDYSGVRFQDWLWVIQYLIDSPATPAAELPFLYNMTNHIYTLGNAIVDYEHNWFVEGKFPTGPCTGNQETLTSHGVNQGMAMKSGAMWYRQSGNTLGVTSSTTRLELMDKYQGVPTGVFQVRGLHFDFLGHIPRNSVDSLSRSFVIILSPRAMFYHFLVHKSKRAVLHRTHYCNRNVYMSALFFP